MIPFTARCPNGHADARWEQKPGPSTPDNFRIICGPCDGIPEPPPYPRLELVSRIPAAPRLFGYRWTRTVVRS